jgi:phosphatidylglycerol:prolipoprotein diacylglycerol transferase
VHEETVDGVVPGSGRVSVTSRVYGLEPGEWTVTADVIRPGIHAGDSRPMNRVGRFSVDPIQPATWSWRRRTLTTIPVIAVKTRWAMLAPLTSTPAVIPGIWAVLGALGIVVALASQAVLLADEGVSVSEGLSVSLLAVVSGLTGAKLWYAALHPRDSWQSRAQGWAVDGLLFVALIVAFGGLLVLDVPIGPYFDAIAPGLFFGVAIGRLGCFFAGCCAGRCTRSRWGIWSSDRRVGLRRVPTQLVESLTGVILGMVTAMLVLGDLPIPSGLIFVSSFAAYVVFRQSLLRMRAERREFSWRRSRSATGT